jgi:hypothetical protein
MNPNLNHDDDEILLPPFDSAKAMRGVFAHRQGEQPEDERLVAQFWQSQGLGVELLESNPRTLSSRLPDLRLLRDGKPFAYCEVKTLWRHTSQIRILHEGRAVEERVEVSNAGVEERLTADVITAIRQLLYANPDHGLLNIVVLVNRDADATAALLAHILNRRLSYKEISSRDWRAERTIKEFEKFRVGVDICLWVDTLAGKNFSMSSYFLLNSRNPQLASEVRNWTGLGEDKQILLQPAA